jgi:hypothetical protein
MRRQHLIGLLLVGGILGACTSGTGVKVDVPDDVQMELEAGAPKEEFTFYALGESMPPSLDDFENHVVVICGKRPPLLPGEVQQLLETGGFLAGTVVQLSSDDFENATKGRLKSKLAMKILVTVRLTFEGCIKAAIAQMEKAPGSILLTERKATFDERNRLREISFQ